MNIKWTEEKIENYKRASEYTAFHRKLSVLAEPYLDERWTLADIGCGPGLMEPWLAPMVKSIDAIDNDALAIGDLKSRLEDVFATQKVIAEKISTRVADVNDLADESWDVVLMSFFGVNKDVLDTVLNLAERRALIFMHGRRDVAGPLAAIDDGEKFTASEMEEYLSSMGMTFKKTVLEMQFGQPFKTIEDIHNYLAEYGMSHSGEIEHIDLADEGDFDDEVVKRIADAEERIIKTNRFDYPYYLPRSISVALFIILINRGKK